MPPIVRAGWVRREPIWCVRSTTQKSSRTTSPRREYAKSGVLSGGKTFVTMMQSANLRNLHDPTHGWRLNRPTDWCVLAQRQMRPGLSIFAEQSFPAQGADDIEKWKCTVIAVLKGRSGGVSNCGCDFACHSPLHLRPVASGRRSNGQIQDRERNSPGKSRESLTRGE